MTRSLSACILLTGAEDFDDFVAKFDLAPKLLEQYRELPDKFESLVQSSLGGKLNELKENKVIVEELIQQFKLYIMESLISLFLTHLFLLHHTNVILF